jgi:hypothetical protein
MFSNPDCKRSALASGGILGCPLDMANATTPISMVDIPREVKGVERSTKYANAVSNVPVNVKLVASVEYVFLNETAFTPLNYIVSRLFRDGLKVLEVFCLISFISYSN